MNRILVTGANGQLGNELKFLSSNSKDSFVFVGHAELDITNANAVAGIFSNQQFDVLINCAAYTAVDKAESERELAYSINAEAPGMLASIARENNCWFMHFSTDFVFDGSTSRPLLEDDATNPLSVYGASKLDGEKKVLANNPKAIIIRTSWVYSSYGHNFVKTILRLCRERDALNVVNDQTGSPTYARDLASVVLQILPQWNPGIYNYGNEGIITWYDFAIAIRDLAGLKTAINPITTSQYPTPATRPKYSVLNKQKIKAAFGLQIPQWRDSLERCMKLL